MNDEKNIQEGEYQCGNFCVFYEKNRIILLGLGMVLLASVVIVSILRDRWANPTQNQVTVFGQGKVEYQPDMATVTLGVQIDRASSAESALNQLNEKTSRIILAIKNLGISEEDIKTQSYNLNPQYDYADGKSFVSGYGASQKLLIKAKNLQDDSGIVSKIISASGSAGSNQIEGVSFSVSNADQLKQEARMKAIADSKKKSVSLFQAAGLKKPGKITGWYENLIQSPDTPANYQYGMGGSEGSVQKSAPAPQVPSGSQEIVVEVGVNYEVK